MKFLDLLDADGNTTLVPIESIVAIQNQAGVAVFITNLNITYRLPAGSFNAVRNKLDLAGLILN